MSNFSELEIIPFALLIIKNHPDGIDTKNLILNLRNLMKPRDEDLEILKNRNDDKFSQKVRNLKSHKTLEKKGYAYFSNDKFYITEHGIEYLNQKDLKNKNSNFNYDFLLINILNEWPLSARTYNSLKNENIIFLGDLLSYNLNDLLKLKNFGKKSLDEIRDLLEKNNINSEQIDYDLETWSDLRDKEKLKLLEQNSKKKISQKSLRSINKFIFKNFENFKNDFFNQEKILIDTNFSKEQIEDLIINDITYILSILNERMVIFFNGRYGYKEDYKTLEELGSKYQITRERVRQLEKDLNLTLCKLGKIDKLSLLKFFEKYEFVSFHKLFPKLDKNFTDTARGTGEITGDKLTSFMENYCGVNQDHFKTPERELWHFDIIKLQEIFKFIPSGLAKIEFIELIKENYGYNDFVSKSAVEFMQNKKLILEHNEKIYALKMNKNLEVVHILNSFPNGLHWKKIAEIGNQSHTDNKWDLDRLVGDSSLNMLSNNDIYLIDRGTYRLFRNCKELIRKNEIVQAFINFLKDENKEQIAMELAFKKIILNEEFLDLNFYDARAIIKRFGSEHGIYHKGTSGTNTIGLNKEIIPISLKDKILNIINQTDGEIYQNKILNQLQKTNESLPLDIHLNDLVDELLIFRTSPGTFMNFNKAISLCNKEKISLFLDKILNEYEFVTQGFVKEIIDNKFYYNFSVYYYSTLCKILSKENNWYYEINYLTKKNNNKIYLDDYIKKNYNMGLSSQENFDNISKIIGLTKRNFMSIIYKPDFKYNINFTENYEH